MKMTNGIFKKIIFSLLLILSFIAAKSCAAQSYSIPSQYEIDQYNKIGEAKTVVSSSDAVQKARVEYLKNQELIGGLNQKIIFSKNINKDTSNSESYLDELRKKQSELDAVLKKSATYDVVIAEGKIAGANGQKKFFESLSPAELASLSKEQKERYEILKNDDSNKMFAVDLNAAKEKNAAAIAQEKEREALARSALPQSPTDPFDCSWDAISCWIASAVYWVPYKISENLLKLSGVVFDYVIDFTIVNMKANIYGSTGTNSAIEVAWTIFRDIANILFIFALIYIAIKTIIQGTGQTGKSIGTVIIVAVLINFSLFFTKVIIDITNTAAISFYNSIVETVGTAATPRDSDIYASEGRSLAESIIMQTGIASSYKVSNGVLAGGWMSVAKQLLLTSVVFFIVAVILFLAVFLLITRFIILAVVMLLSSLAFGSYIFPKLRSQISDKWWSALIGQSFVAPVFLVMLFVTFKIMGAIGIKSETTGNGFGDFFTLQPDLLLKYSLVIGMLIFSIKTAKSLSDQAGGMAGTITKAVGGFALGGAAMLARGGLGGIAGTTLKGLAGKGDGLGSRIARSAGNKLSTSSFDLRNSKNFQRVAGQTGVDLDKGKGEGGMEKGWKNWRENDKILTGSAIGNLINPNEKMMKEQVALQEKRFKGATKFTDEQQEAMNKVGAFRNDSKYSEAVKVYDINKTITALEAKKAAATDPAVKAKINSKIIEQEKLLNKKTLTVEEANKLLEDRSDKNSPTYNDPKYSDLVAAETAAKADVTKRSNAFKKSRKSAYGREWLKGQKAKDAKEKKDTDDIVAALEKSKTEAPKDK